MALRLGIDFGTTRTVVAVSDRGNFPVVSFTDDAGDAHEHIPSVIAERGGSLVFGFDAVAAARDGAPMVRSCKRALAAPDVGADTLLRVGRLEVRLLDALAGFLRHVRDSVLERSNVPGASAGAGARKKRGAREELEVVVAVPAHAHGAQRFLTLEAFRLAGFAPRALLNEPSAAGLEYTHRQGRTVSSKRTRVVVYDLGGGTFDASLVRVHGGRHDVLATAGHNRLGGDDFDDALCALVLERAGLVGVSAPTATERFGVLEACREAKERLTPQSKKLAIDVAGDEVIVPVDELYERVAPLVERSVTVMAPLLRASDEDERADSPADSLAGTDAGATGNLDDIAGIYTVGGASGLPLVARVLRERFGRRVHRSPYPAAACAIGLAIAADDQSGVALVDRLSRTFGVFRERDAGRVLAFDALLTPDTPLGGVPLVRRYRAKHNVGHFRFVECAAVDATSGEPAGDLVPCAEVRFPFESTLRGRDLRAVEVTRNADGEGPVIEERYLVDDAGMIALEIEDLAAGYVERFRLHGR